MKLSPIVLEKLNADITKLQLAQEMNVKFTTVDNWIKARQNRFENFKVMKAVEKVTGINIKDQFIEEK
ncbi:Uncharacterised protein [Candidatus Ornithobacterium hominis]|uniref:HTH cro/C1-type domain-containing protein n=1 Tax=Candidatus Ornithobacterium hominis TaxID=2497989 RepID=A0A383U5Y0_9FLAO|nr:hypothetical protein [Candidatus Ornithobacterium hominis]MCT7905256.1 hypothetical protein [Candidatus Ornithobacterium hominis]SZD74343.1 Uncharacterised protein [Candidatus Ornithobacterium hominis]